MGWKCSSCGEVIQDQFEECWRCSRKEHECPQCNQKITVDAVTCPDCDSDFETSTEATTSSISSFPEEPYAYKPSGKTNILVVLLMPFLGLYCAAIGGMLLKYLVLKTNTY